ncbi:SAM-dependent methyltransferase [Rhizobium sp. M10]|uniref:class I SAM-dependent DNA methyltransferase n=1 Tax=Rhizobium sp. M10 TaxID=1324586 RepID=UPI000BE9BBCC|nr:class I SAM-dependent methyltransferase [Rhizobium sp. M10]PDT37258.1 SAM-dependent methyltransferase [Rhizobium sp. M10]
MTTSFGLYSQYYDLLYKDKDYEGETAYVKALLDRHATRPVTRILELGSGTGIHAGMIAEAGYEVLGVELSETMLAAAMPKAAKANGKLDFSLGDARSFRTDRRFQAVISLFHVLSYQISDADLEAMMETVSYHLEDGGIFIFDFWYGPAVLWQRPSTRTKRLENDEVSIVRIAESVVHDAESVVDVNYTIFATEKPSAKTEMVCETHRMRYLFLTEIDRLLANAGMSRVVAEEWMSGAAPGTETWGVCVVARKNVI